MRILFTFSGNRGHLDPLLPIARAAERAGHTVALTGRPWMVPKVEQLGLRAFPAGSDRGLVPEIRPLVAVNLERELKDMGGGFGGRIARERSKDILPLCRDWRPDLLVCDETDPGAMIVAEELGLPYATVNVLAAGSMIRPEYTAEPLNKARAEHGLSPDDTLEMLSRYLVLSPFPPSLRDPAFPPPITLHSIRPAVLDDIPNAPLPLWVTDLRAEPTIYFTLGTVFPLESGDLFARVIAGVRELPVNLIVTVGREMDPAELGAQPPNVHIEQYIPQASLLPLCDLVVSHAGSGSVVGALAFGLPMVLIPMGADQPLNAERCDALGVARVLDPVHVTAEQARDAVSLVLAEPMYRINAERLQDECLALPDADDAVTLLEQLLRDGKNSL